MDVARRQRLLAVVAGAFPSLDTSVNVAFPAIDEQFSLAVADLQWIVICYLLPYGALLVAAGRIGDSVGYRRLVWWGATISIAGLAGCAAAPTFVLFLAARVVQGVGTALVLAGAPALLTTAAHRTSSPRPGRAVGLFQTATMVGLTIGPVIGGPLVEYLGWRAVFWSRIPVAVALVVVATGLTRNERRAERSPTQRIDTVELAAGVGAVAGLVAVVSVGRTWGWSSPLLLMVAACALAVAALFIRRNRTTAMPMIHPDLWRRAGFRRANILNLVANGAAFPTWLLVPTLLVDEIGIAVIASGLVLAVSPALSSLSSAWIGQWVDAADLNRVAAIGLLIQASGLMIIGMLGPTGSIAFIIVGLALVGLGLGIFLVPNMHHVMASLPVERQGVAGGLSLMMRTVGIVVAVAAWSAILDPIQRSNGFDDGFRSVFVIAAVVVVAAAFVAEAGRRDQLDIAN